MQLLGENIISTGELSRNAGYDILKEKYAKEIDELIEEFQHEHEGEQRQHEEYMKQHPEQRSFEELPFQ